MTILLAILKSIGSAIGKMLGAMPYQFWLFVAGFLVCAVVMWKGCDGGGCGCGCRRDPQPKYRTHGPYKVKSIDSATSLTWLLGRRDKREQAVILAWIEGPTDSTQAEEARAKLETMIGNGPITVEVHRRGPVEAVPEPNKFDAWFDEHKKTCEQCAGGPSQPICKEAFSYLQDCMRASTGRLDDEAVVQSIDEETGEVQPESKGLEARKLLVGIVVNSAGLNCNRALVAAGYATCTPEAPESWQGAEKKAKKAKLGMWGKTKELACNSSGEPTYSCPDCHGKGKVHLLCDEASRQQFTWEDALRQHWHGCPICKGHDYNSSTNAVCPWQTDHWATRRAWFEEHQKTCEYCTTLRDCPYCGGTGSVKK